MKNIEPPAQKRTTAIAFVVLLILVIAATVWMVGPYLLAVIMGGILALMAYPVFRTLAARGLWPKVASALVTLGVVLLVIVPVTIFISLAVKQGIAIGRAVAANESLSFQAVISRVNDWALIDMMGIGPEELNAKAHEWIQNAEQLGTGAVVNIATYLPNIVLQLALACIACFFLLLDGKRLLHWIRNKVPLDDDVGRQIVASFKNTAIASIWAMLAAGAAQSVVIFFGYLILGVEGAFLAAGATFVFAWIPVVGSAPVWLIGAIYLYSQNSIGKAIVMIAIGLVAGVVDNIVRPLVLKGRSNMHPLVSLVAIFGGIRLFGIVGVFLGPILAAVMISLLQAWPAVAKRFGLMSSTL